MSTPKTVSFYTLGCKLNFSETSAIGQSFKDNGYHFLPFEQGADIVVINTCTVTDMADKKNRKVIRRAREINPQSMVVVVGCYAQLKPEEIASMEGVDLVLGAGEKFRILHYIDNLSKTDGKAQIVIGEVENIGSFHDAYSFGDRTRSFLKIQDGCDYSCTFCTIPKARGKSRSGTIEEVVNNAKNIAAKGIREIVLTGVNIGDFGNSTAVIDGNAPKEKHAFSHLVKALDEVENIERFRISSIEPNLLTEDIIEFISTSKRFVPHFHIPLQSGSDTILKAMKRRYLTALYRNRIDFIRQTIPHACIGVDVIVGFPGESEELFLETFEFLNGLDISYLHVFSYSEREGTPAATMEGKVPAHIKKARHDILFNLSLKKQRLFYESHLGQIRRVLVEKSKNPELLTGFTDNYIKVSFPYQEGLRNQMVDFKLGSINEQYLVEGEMVLSVN